MATLSQIKIGQITYNICDVPTLNNLKSIKSSVDQINTKINQINYNKSTGLNMNRIYIPNYSISLASGSSATGNILTFNLPSKPAYGVWWINGLVNFNGDGKNPTSTSDSATVDGRLVYKSPGATSWSYWDRQVLTTLLYRQAQTCQLKCTPNTISALNTNAQFAFQFSHSNAGRKSARTCNASGWIILIWSDPYPTSKTFSATTNTSTPSTTTVKYS